MCVSASASAPWTEAQCEHLAGDVKVRKEARLRYVRGLNGVGGVEKEREIYSNLLLK